MRGTTQKKQQQKNTLGIVTCANGSIEQKQETDRQTDGHWRPLLLGVTLTTSSNVCWWYRCQWTSAITLDFTCGLQFLCIYFFRKIFWNCFVPQAEASRSDVIHIRLWLFFLSQSFFSLLNFHFNLLNRKTNQQKKPNKNYWYVFTALSSLLLSRYSSALKSLFCLRHTGAVTEWVKSKCHIWLYGLFLHMSSQLKKSSKTTDPGLHSLLNVSPLSPNPLCC